MGQDAPVIGASSPIDEAARKRFWANINKGPHPKGCWLWQKSNRRGYGRIKIKGRTYSTHRLAWFLKTKTAPPNDLFVCHRCDVKLCCRFDHLFLGTAQQNSADRDAKGRQAKGDWISAIRREHAARGHRNGRYTKPEAFIAKQPRGEKHGRAKLSELEVNLIRSCAAAGHKQAALARAFNISKASICLIVNQKQWRHLAGSQK